MAEIKYTKKGLARMKRNKEIVASYQDLSARNPDVKPERIFAGIADEFKMTSASVRNICKKEGVYVGRQNPS